MSLPPESRLTKINFTSPAFLYPAVGLICALAVFFRIWDLGSRSLWTDEAWVALAALKGAPAEALAAGASTPPLYILTLWGLVQLLGGSEAALRSLSFFFGLGTVLLFIPLSRFLSLPGWLLGTAMVAVSPIMVYFSRELKQYSGDAFFAVLIFLLAERLMARRGEKGWTALVLAGIVGLGFSHALVFTLPVAAAVLWVKLPQSRRRVMLLSGCWAMGFAAFYFIFFRGQVDPELTAYWSPGFPDFSSLPAFMRWLGASLERYFHYFLGKWGIFAGPALLAGGIWSLAREKASRALVYLGGPLLLTLAAAALHRYPFMAPYAGNRLMLFSAPLLYLVAAAGLGGILAWLCGKRRRVAASVLAGLALLAFNPLKIAQENLHSGYNREEIKPLVAYLEKQAQPQDLIYVYYFAISPFKYYSQGVKARLWWGKSCNEKDLALLANQGGVSPRRVWLLASHIPNLEHIRRFSIDLLGQWWQEKACLTQEGAVLFCFEWEKPRVAAKESSFPSKLDE